ncbi:MAG TPA: TMEM175 family protein [Vicinamibacterales bacterium]|nr:TMEM175 family protein [Vicinamibacterales bacterium]
MLTLRKHKISRLEEFSDAVFGFALTLLVITNDVPRSYGELLALLQGIPAFACCFALLVWIWYEHDAFFERFPLQDGRTVLLNSGLLFVVLLYIYPLKFMFDAFMLQVFKLGAARPVQAMSFDELARASAIYGFGFFALMSLFALLYLNATRQAGALELGPLEVFDASTRGRHHLLSAAVGLFAVALALFLPRQLAYLSPASLGLMGPLHAVYGRYMQRRRARLEAALRPALAAAEAPVN